jgi:hypothetical protein
LWARKGNARRLKLDKRRWRLPIEPRHPSGFDQLMDKTIASARVDRVMHHADVTRGHSLDR